MLIQGPGFAESRPRRSRPTKHHRRQGGNDMPMWLVVLLIVLLVLLLFGGIGYGRRGA
jgi:type VI protein secretion system component VasF